MSSLLDLKQILESSKKIAIFSHAIPDADAICSCLALKNIIETNFEKNTKKVDIFIDTGDGISSLYEQIIGTTPISQRNFKKYDLAVSLDCTQQDRFLKYEQIFKKAKQTVNIDHHASNTNFADLNFVVTRASSTGEILFQFAKVLNYKLTPVAAKHIFTSILTDTACLTQSNVSKLTYKVLAELSSMNFDQEEVKNHFFKNNTKVKIFLLQKALSSIRFYEDDKVAIMKITQKDMEKLEATQEDTLGIVEHANNIEGVMTAAIIIESAPQKCYVSLRAKSDINVSEIAKEFGGGGHNSMAAFQYEGEVKDLKMKLSQKLIQAVKEKEESLLNEDLQNETK